jgi:hypothetical protein
MGLSMNGPAATVNRPSPLALLPAPYAKSRRLRCVDKRVTPFRNVIEKHFLVTDYQRTGHRSQALLKVG